MLWNDEPCRIVAELHLGSWEEVAPRLLPRLIPTMRDGPPAWEVGIDIPSGIVLVDRALTGAWAVASAVGEAMIWQRAVANLADRPAPPRALIPGTPQPVLLLAGGPWTTGWLLRWPGSRAVAVAEDLALVAVGGPSRDDRAPDPDPDPGPCRTERVDGCLLELADRLAAGRADRWPPTVLTVPVGVPFVERPILE